MKKSYIAIFEEVEEKRTELVIYKLAMTMNLFRVVTEVLSLMLDEYGDGDEFYDHLLGPKNKSKIIISKNEVADVILEQWKKRIGT